jgi:hypothetical protein
VKEYWVNVYERSEGQVLGAVLPTKKLAETGRLENCIGCLHVKLKEQKPKRSWDNLNATDWMKP